jgi:hypothetical protein
MSKERAIEMRLEGKSRSQIVAALGLKTGGSALSRWLRGVPAPDWTHRPNAKDELRAIAVELRKEGRSYREIQEVVPVSKSTLSLWLRDVLVDEAARSRLADRERASRENAAAAIRARRVAKEARIVGDARAQIPASIAESGLFLVGLALYWAEGSKAKPWNPSEGVCLINSDPDVIRVFLAWLALLGVDAKALRFRVAIHNSGNVAAAEQFWADVVGISRSELQRTTLKTHERRPSRRLATQDYVGCLVVKVDKSTDFNRQIAGWWQGLVAAVATVEAPSGMV